MKLIIFSFLTWVFSAGFVASYPNHQVDYLQKGYFPHTDRANSQGYANARVSSEPAFPQYTPQHMPHYAHNLPLTKPQLEQEHHLLPEAESVQNEKEFNAPVLGRENWNIQADAYNAQPAAPLPNSYQETSRPHQSEINYNYAGNHLSSWPPGNPEFEPESYSPPIHRQWRHPYSYAPPVPVNPQESYQPHVQHPYWQSRVPAQNYYYSPLNEQNIYDPPVQYAAHAEAQAQVPSEYNLQNGVSQPESVKNTPSAKHSFLLVHPNGTTERVDVLHDTMLGTSPHIKTFKKAHETETKNMPHDENKNLDEFKNVDYAHDDQKHKDENHTEKNKNSQATPVDYTNNNYYHNPHFKTSHHEYPTENVWDHNQNKHTLPVNNKPQDNHTHPENKYSNPALVQNDDGNKQPEKSPMPYDIGYGKNKEGPTTNDITTQSPYNKNFTKEIDYTQPENEYSNPSLVQNDDGNKIPETSHIPQAIDYGKIIESPTTNGITTASPYNENYTKKSDYTHPENEYSNPSRVQNDDGNKIPETSHIPQAIDYGKNIESPTTNGITTASPYNENYTKKSDYTHPENEYSNPALVQNDDDNKNPEKSPIPQAIDYEKNIESPTTNGITTASPYIENYTEKFDDTFSGDVIPTTEGNLYEVAPGSTWNPEDNSKVNTTPGYDDDSFSVIEVIDEAHRKDDDFKREGNELKKHMSNTESSPFIENEIKTLSSMDTGSPDDTKGNEEGDAKLQSKLLSQLNKAGFSLDFDSGSLKHSDKKISWLPANELWSELLTPENMAEYDSVVVFNVALTPVIQKNSTVYLYGNGTIKEEIIETSWNHIGDTVPRQIKTTIIITNPDI